MKKIVRNNAAGLLNRIQYAMLLIYVVLVYIFNGNEAYDVLIDIPLLVFMAIELGYVLKTKSFKVTKHILVLFMFVSVCFLTCIWAQEKDLAMNRSLTMLYLATSFVFMYNYCVRTKRNTDDILKLLLIAGLVFLVYVICYYGIGNLFSMFGSDTRFGREINNENAVGIQLAVTALIAIYYGMSKNRKCYLLAVVPIILSLFTASRKAIVCIILGIIVLIFMEHREKYSVVGIVKKIVLPCIILLVALFVIQANVFPSLTNRLGRYYNSFTQSGKVDSSTLERNEFIRYGMMSFLEHPIGGIGVRNSGIITMEATGRDTYLHNNYVELLATTGIIGFIVYYYIFASILIFSFKNRKSKDASIVIMVFAVCLVLDWGMVSYYSKVTYIYLLLGTLFYTNVSKGLIGNEKIKD